MFVYFWNLFFYTLINIIINFFIHLKFIYTIIVIKNYTYDKKLENKNNYIKIIK